MIAPEMYPPNRRAIILREVNALRREFNATKAAMLESIAATQYSETM
jgi:hypothetical protein